MPEQLPAVTYVDDMTPWLPGMETRAADRHSESRVNAQLGRPQIVNIVFALTWAADDDVVITIGGTPTQTIAAAGEDTPEEVRDAALDDVLVETAYAEFGTFSSVGTDTIRWTSREIPGTVGHYYSVPITAVATTAGNGTAVATQSQSRQNRGDMPFGIGVAIDVTDTRGKRCARPAATGFIFGGAIPFGHVYENRLLRGTDGIPAQEAFPGIMRGYLACRVDSDVVAAIVAGGRAVFLKHTEDALGPNGNFRHNNTNADALTSARFTGRTQSVGGVDLAEIYFNAP